MLNDYAFGGFLIFEHVRPFIDARVELYGDGMLSLYDKLRSGDHEAVEDALKRYDIAWTIFAPDNRIVATLDREPGLAAPLCRRDRCCSCAGHGVRAKGSGEGVTARDRRSKESWGSKAL